MINQHIKFDDALKKQKETLKKINEVKIGKKTPKQKEIINNIENSREEVLNSFKDYSKMVFDAGYKGKLGKRLKALTELLKWKVYL